MWECTSWQRAGRQEEDRRGDRRGEGRGETRGGNEREKGGGGWEGEGETAGGGKNEGKGGYRRNGDKWGRGRGIEVEDGDVSGMQCRAQERWVTTLRVTT